MKVKENLRNHSRLKDIEEIWQLNATCGSEMDPFAKRLLLKQ